MMYRSLLLSALTVGLTLASGLSQTLAFAQATPPPNDCPECGKPKQVQVLNSKSLSSEADSLNDLTIDGLAVQMIQSDAVTEPERSQPEMLVASGTPLGGRPDTGPDGRPR